VPDPTPGKNRAHLDFVAEDVDGEVSRLTAAGASEVERHNIGEFHWVVLPIPRAMCSAWCVVVEAKERPTALEAVDPHVDGAMPLPVVSGQPESQLLHHDPSRAIRSTPSSW